MLKSYHRIVIMDHEFDSTYNVMRKQVEELNKLHPRCKAETVDRYDNATNKDRHILVGNDSFVRLSFLKFEEVEK